jgi:hypothetical protein
MENMETFNVFVLFLTGILTLPTAYRFQKNTIIQYNKTFQGKFVCRISDFFSSMLQKHAEDGSAAAEQRRKIWSFADSPYRRSGISWTKKKYL